MIQGKRKDFICGKVWYGMARYGEERCGMVGMF